MEGDENGDPKGTARQSDDAGDAPKEKTAGEFVAAAGTPNGVVSPLAAAEPAENKDGPEAGGCGDWANELAAPSPEPPPAPLFTGPVALKLKVGAGPGAVAPVADAKLKVEPVRLNGFELPEPDSEGAPTPGDPKTGRA